MAPGLVSPEKAARGKMPVSVIWHTIVSPTGREKTGYPTQKPEGLVRRFVHASSRPGDLVLDPFAGSGTLGAVAAATGRRYLLMDESPDAVRVMRERLGGVSRVVARGPGRVNLIGEHTDYNDGLALPFAIDRGVTVTAEPLGGDRIEAHAADLGERRRVRARRRGARASGWRAFVRGTVAELRAAGHAVRPCRLTIEGDLPHGSGLSSSAALEAALCLALLEDPDVDRVELAKLCSRVENDYVGARTGLLDQLAVLCARGRPRAADRLPRPRDRARAARARRLAARDARLGRLPRARRRRLQRAPRGVRRRLRGARRSPACATRRRPTGCPEPLDRRVRHVLTENARVDAMADALAAGDLERGRARCSTPRTRACATTTRRPCPRSSARSTALKRAGAAGARMVGGGFGGSVLALFAARRDRRRTGACQSPPAPPPAGSDSASSSCSAERARERPREEERADEQHRQPRPEVHVDAGRLVDVGVGGADAEHEQDHAVDQRTARR